MNLENVTTEDWIVGGLALLLAIALLVFPWFHISVSVGAFSASASYSATGTPDGWLGVLAFIASLLVLGDLAVERLSPQTQIPEIGGSRTATRFILAIIAAFFVVLKFLFHIHFSLFGWGFYVTVVITAALVVFAAQANGGPAIAGLTGTGGTSAGTAPPPPPPPPTAGTSAGTGPGESSGGSTPPPGS